MDTNKIKQFIPYEEALKLSDLGITKFAEYHFGYYVNKKLRIRNFIDLINKKSKLLNCNVIETLHSSQYNPICLTPTYSQVFDWFRIKYNLFHWIVYKNDEPINKYECSIIHMGQPDFKLYCEIFNTYEEAELACVRKLIEIVNNGQNKRAD